MPQRSRPLALFASLTIVLGSVLVAAAVRPNVVLAAAPVATCAADSGSATISGTVTGSGGTPVSNVLVSAYTIYGRRGGYDYTDASGVYTVNTLIGGSYLLRYEPGGGTYAAEWYNNAATPQTATPVNVAEAGAVSGINLQLDPGARFDGTVSGQGGGPLQNVQVSVYDTSGRTVANAYTDSAGAYITSPGLPTGNYRVGFRGTAGFLDAYYDGKTTLATAEVIDIVAPTIRSDVDAVLAPGGQINGTVIEAATGTPVKNVSVSANGQYGSGNDYTDANGKYTITGLGSGSYEIEVEPSSATNLVTASQTAQVTAPNPTVNVNFGLTVGGTLSGKVTDTGGAPLQYITIYIDNQDGSFQQYTSTNASGQYSVTGLPTGEYRVLFRPSEYIPEAYNNHPNFGDADLITVIAPGTVTTIDGVLAKGSAIKGKVTDAATGLPIKGIFVEVLDTGGERVESTTTQADGTYQTYTTLPSGSYRVLFNADERNTSCAYVGNYYNGNSSVPNADIINLTAPSVATNIDAALTRGSVMFGKVTDATTNQPITSGQVTIYDANGKFVMFGRLSFTGGWQSETALPSGNYRVLFSDYNSQYVDEYYNNKFTLDTANPVTLTAPNDITGLDASLSKGAAISGHVTAADTGQPFSAGSIVVYDANNKQVGYAGIQTDGSYAVTNGLASGSYRIGVIPYNRSGSQASAASRSSIAALDSTTLAYSPTFYRGTVMLSAATPLALSAPNTTSNIDIAILHSASIPIARR